MELEVLKKKISTYKTEGGSLKNVSNEILMEILYAWEQWVGPAKTFAATIGVNKNRLPTLIGEAKKLKREGIFPEEVFREIKISDSTNAASLSPCQGIEILWDNSKIIRFPQVEQLFEFLKKVA